MIRLEKELYKPILDFLNLQRGCCAWLNWNNAIYLPSAKCFVRKRGHRDGVADILGVKMKVSGRLSYGQSFAFEVKREAKKMSDVQKLWAEKYVNAGGIYYMVDSLDDVMEAYTEI